MKKAVAMDVRKGPLSRATENIALAGLADKIETRLSDGVAKLLPGEADSVVIAGMGGELIAQIIDRSDYTRIPGVRLILQPMSSLQELRGYLAEMGYATVCERLCRVGGKYCHRDTGGICVR